MKSIGKYFGGNGDSSKSCKNRKESRKVSLLELPSKVRDTILKYLDPASLLSMRQICTQIQRNIDYRIGIKGVIIDSTKTNAFIWIQTIAIQSCKIIHLKDPFSWNLLVKPAILRKIYFDENFPICPEIIGKVLSKFYALQDLSFYIKAEGKEGDGFCCETQSKLINLLTSNFIKSLHIEFIHEQWILLWKVKFTSNRIQKLVLLKNDPLSIPQVQEIYLKMPMISESHRSLWLTFLFNVEDIQSLYLDLGDICYELFIPIIEINSASLVQISLSHVRTCNKYGEVEPLDWSMFEDCKSLKCLELSCGLKRIPCHTISTIGMKSPLVSTFNLDKIPTRNLEVVFLSYISFTELEFQTIMSPSWAPKIVTGCLCHCGINNKPTSVTTFYLSKQPDLRQENDCQNSFHYPISEYERPVVLEVLSSAFNGISKINNLVGLLLTGYLLQC